MSLQSLTKQEHDALRNQQPMPLADAVKFIRNLRLAASDWTQLNNSPVDVDAWHTYRQELRDITKQAGFPKEVVWPVPPI